jgi:hypothetical protein
MNQNLKETFSKRLSHEFEFGVSMGGGLTLKILFNPILENLALSQYRTQNRHSGLFRYWTDPISAQSDIRHQQFFYEYVSVH